MERFQRNMKQAMQETGNSKRIFFLEILIPVCILMGCGVQETDQAQELAPEPVTVHSSEEIPQMDRMEEEEEAEEEEAAEAEDKPHVFTNRTAELLLEQAEKAMEKAMERADTNNEEHPAEEEIRSYLSGYFDPDILDYVLYVYQIKIEDGKCFYNYYDHYQNFYMNADAGVQIIEQGEDYCDISVIFQHRWHRAWDEEEGTVRVEKDERGYWVITKMNQWYNDLRYYYMRDTDYEPVYLTKEAAEWLIREFGTDENGEKVQLCAQTDEDGYILQGSSEHRLTEEEIGALSRYELFLAAQEIYAENGKKFGDVFLYGYFWKKTWYEPYKGVFDENSLTEIQRYNIDLLAEAGNLGELAQAAYGNRYGKEEKAAGSPLGAEEAACIIGDAFNSLGDLFVSKPENKIEELSDDVGKYYSLGEYSSEEKLREYVSMWFSEDAFEYLMCMCSIMHGVEKDENGNYMLMRDLTLPMDQYVLDDFSGVVIKEYTDMECTVSVTFENLNARPQVMAIYNEGEMVLKREGDRWVITEISEPHYDEYYESLWR